MFDHFFDHILFIDWSIWSFFKEELESDDTNGIVISSERVSLRLHDFGRHVSHCTRVYVRYLIFIIWGNSEICEKGLTLFIK